MLATLRADVRILAAIAILCATLTGCAGLGIGGGSGDVDSLRNAIVMDDVGYVRNAVRSGRVGVNDRIPAPVYMEGAPIIAIAARAGSVEVVRFLIESRADLNQLTPAGETALMLASYFKADGDATGRASFERHERVARMLVEAGASLENVPHSYTPLSYAAFQGHDHIIVYLLERGAQVNGGSSPPLAYINTPLMMAAMQGHRSSVLLLLRAGADARIRVHLGLTAAELAAKYQGKNMVPMLRCAEKMPPGERFASMCENVRQ